MNGADIKDFKLESWHVALFFFTFVVGIFKSEILNWSSSLMIVREKKFAENEPIQILSSSGEWEDAVVLEYQIAIPFTRAGGVTLEYKNKDGSTYTEKLSFVNWKDQRTRSHKRTEARGQVSV